MLRITEDAGRNCLILEPSGPLTRADLDRLAERFDGWAAEHGRPPGLLIHAAAFPSWADFGALARHVRFIRRHHRQVPRVAFVSDARAFDVAPLIARRLVTADVRHFPEKDLDAALAWLAAAGEPAVTLMPDLPDNVVGLSVRGVVHARDYQEIIIPEIERKLARYPRIRLLYRLGPELEALSAGAVWNDAMVGLKHLTGFERVAVVSDVGWIRHSVAAFAPLIPAEVQVFGDGELAAAKAWIAR